MLTTPAPASGQHPDGDGEVIKSSNPRRTATELTTDMQTADTTVIGMYLKDPFVYRVIDVSHVISVADNSVQTLRSHLYLPLRLRQCHPTLTDFLPDS